MKKLIALIALTFITSNAYALRVEEADGSPSLNDVALIKVSNGSITASGTRQITVTTGSSVPDFGGVSGFVTSNSGAAVVTAMADDQVLVASGATTVDAKSIADCDDSGGNHLNYDTATNMFSCGTSAPASASGWTDAGATIGLTTTTDNVGIGGSPLGKLSVIGDTDEVQIHGKGNGTQTSNLMLLEKSDGTDVLSVSNVGNMILAGTLTLGGGSGATTFGDNTTASYVITFDLSGTDHTMTASSGALTLTGNLIVPTESYDATAWNGVNQTPTKDAVRDKIETMLATSNSQILCANSATSQTNTFYMGMGGANSTTESIVKTGQSPVNVTIRKLYANVQTAPGAGDSWTVTVRENTTNTALTCTISGGASTSCNDTSNSFTLDAGNYMTVAFADDGDGSTASGGDGFCVEAVVQ